MKKLLKICKTSFIIPLLPTVCKKLTIIAQKTYNTYMIIDFHAHCYPDSLSHKAVYSIDDDWKDEFSEGTYRGLKKGMAEVGIDKAVVLPVCHKPDHEDVINGFVFELTLKDDSLIPFASVHPDTVGATGLVYEYAKKGIKGIKFHPPLQRFDIASEKLLPIYKAIKDCGLIAVFHCGKVGRERSELDLFPTDFEKILHHLGDKVVLAHMGGYGIKRDELDVLYNLPVYVGTSLSARQFTIDEYTEAIEKIGADRLLFGSDVPWGDVKRELDYLAHACANVKDWEKITCENAKRLLGIN